MQLQDRSGGSIEQLAGYVQQLTKAVTQRPEIGRVSTTFNPATPQVRVELDREKARTLGVTVDSVFATLQAYLSGLYVNDFVRFGRVYKVFLQAEPQFTDKPDKIGQFYVRNSDGGMVPLSTLVKVSKMSGPNVVTRFNLYNAAEIMGAPAPGYSSGQAMKAIEEVMKTMPSEVGYEWSGLTLQEKKSEGSIHHRAVLAPTAVVALHGAQGGRVEGQKRLQALDGVHEKEAKSAERQQPCGV